MLVKPVNALLRGLAPLARSHPRARGLVAWWPFGDGAGTVAADVSGFSNHGVLTNMVATTDWLNGPRGGILNFDGSDAYVEMPDRASYYAVPLTISCWVYLDQLASTKGEDMIFLRKRRSVSNFTQWQLSQSSSNGNCTFQVRNSADTLFQTNSNVAMVALQWYHVLATLDSGFNMRLYMNGILQTDNDAAGSINTTSASVLRVGANSNTALRLDGKMEDVRLYERLLSETDVMALYLDPLMEWKWAMQQHVWRMPLGVAAAPAAGPGRGSLMLMGAGR